MGKGILIKQVSTVVSIFLMRFVGVAGTNWILHQKTSTLESSLVENQNLDKFLNISHTDNEAFKNDESKMKRSYDNGRCIGDLKFLQNNLRNETNGWGFESKFRSVNREFVTSSFFSSN